MPRSTQSRGVRRGRKDATPEPTFDERMTDEEREEFAGMLAPEPVVDEAQDEQVEQALNHAVEEQPDEREWTVDALHGRDFDWTTMTWSPPKGTSGGTRPCLCNRVRGHECDLPTKSRFSIGHDARFKGILQTAFRQGRRLSFAFEADDHAVVTDAEGNPQPLVGEVELEADAIARLVAPKLLPHVTHTSRAAQLQKLDAEAGTTVPQTAVMGAKPDEELTEADIDAQVDDAAGADEGN
jgi:hypothetical protein